MPAKTELINSVKPDYMVFGSKLDWREGGKVERKKENTRFQREKEKEKMKKKKKF